MNIFLKHLQEHPSPAPLGSWIMSASPLVAEAMGHAGYRWAVVDMEHTPLDMMEVIHILQAVAGTPMLPVVRVPWNDAVMIKRVLDAGATTVLVPFVQNAEEARQAVRAMLYPPLGHRGMAAMSRASRFGTTPDYLKNANRFMSVIVQLETPEAIAQLEAIAAVEGIDALFIGPGDLSASMGHVGNAAHPDVIRLTQDAVNRAHAAGKLVGTVGGTPSMVRQYREMGFDFVAIASDLAFLVRSAQAAVQELSGPATQTPPAATAAIEQNKGVY